MELVQSLTRRLAEDTSTKVLALWAAVESGELSQREFRSLAASLIATANAAGVTLADLGLTAEVIRQTRRPSVPLGLRPDRVQADQERIAVGLDGVLAEQPSRADTPELLAESRRARLSQFARSEPLLTVATAVQTGMARHGAQGWVRQTSGKSCPLCVNWDDGAVRPATVRMIRHNGCNCLPAPQFF
jgi:hypothetical protein